MIARLDPYLALAQAAFQRRLAYRSEAWGGVLGQCALAIMYVSVWHAVYAGREIVDGVSLGEMRTYGILGGAFLAAFPWVPLLNAVGESLRTGDVAIQLLRPWRYLLHLLAQEAGNIAFNLLFIVAPSVLLVGLGYGLQWPPTALDAAFAVALWALGTLISFLIATLGALVAFWLLTVFSIEWMLRGFYYLLSGTMVPLWFFPETFAALVERLPFAFIAFYPMAAWLGKIPGERWPEILVLGLAWSVALSALAAWLWHRAVRRLVVQGG